MVDLIGASVKTLGHENEQTEVIVTEGDEVRVSSNSKLKTKFGLICMDLPEIDKVVKVGGKISINYGKVVLQVEKFEEEEKYLQTCFRNQEAEKKNLKEQASLI